MYYLYSMLPDIFSAVNFQSKNPDTPQFGNPNLAVIPIFGVIEKKSSLLGSLFGSTSLLGVQQQIKNATRNPDINSILLLIDSPGGNVDGLYDTADMLFDARKNGMHIVAQVSGVAASAAYALASQSHTIYSNRLDWIGSIGTYAVIYDTSEKAMKEGIKPIIFSSSEYKTTGIPGTSLTENQKREIQNEVDRYSLEFQKLVLRTRPNINPDVFGGKVYFADDALSLGLIDGIQNLDITFNRLPGTKRSSKIRAEITRRIFTNFLEYNNRKY